MKNKREKDYKDLAERIRQVLINDELYMKAYVGGFVNHPQVLAQKIAEALEYVHAYV